MREGEGDDLPGIGRVGQDFLIARDAGVEADLADGASRGAESVAPEYRAVGENQRAGWLRPPGRRGMSRHSMNSPGDSTATLGEGRASQSRRQGGAKRVASPRIPQVARCVRESSQAVKLTALEFASTVHHHHTV